MENKAKEVRTRRTAKRLGYVVKKSRERYVYPESATNHGEFMLIDASTNVCILGPKFNTTLEEIERFLLEAPMTKAAQSAAFSEQLLENRNTFHVDPEHLRGTYIKQAEIEIAEYNKKFIEADADE